MASLSEDELAVIALILDEEESPRKKRKRNLWVHKAWTERETEGEFFTLYKELVDDPTKFHQYFRMSEHAFNILFNTIADKIKRRNTSWRKAIKPRERLAICLR